MNINLKQVCTFIETHLWGMGTPGEVHTSLVPVISVWAEQCLLRALQLLFYIGTKHSGGTYLTAFWTSYHAYTVPAFCDVFVCEIWERSQWWDKHGRRAGKCCALVRVMGTCIVHVCFKVIVSLAAMSSSSVLHRFPAGEICRIFAWFGDKA